MCELASDSASWRAACVRYWLFKLPGSHTSHGDRRPTKSTVLVLLPSLHARIARQTGESISVSLWLKERFSKFGTLTSVVLPTPRTVRVVLLIIPSWVVPSAPGLNKEPPHLNHLSLVLRIVALRVSHLAQIRFLGLLLAFARQGSAFRRPAGSQLHLAHLTVN